MGEEPDVGSTVSSNTQIPSSRCVPSPHPSDCSSSVTSITSSSVISITSSIGSSTGASERTKIKL